MHDSLEGICLYEIKLILNHYVYVEKYFDFGFFEQANFFVQFWFS